MVRSAMEVGSWLRRFLLTVNFFKWVRFLKSRNVIIQGNEEEAG